MPKYISHDFIDRLSERLSAPLPGWKIQQEMSVTHRGKLTFDINTDTPPVESSVLIMLFEKEGEYYFPLIKRALYPGIHSGQIGLPGGKTEPEDFSRIETALRETEEEIGVNSKRIKVIGLLSRLHVQASNYNVQPVIGIYSDIPEYLPDPGEVSEVIECKVKGLLNSTTKKEKELLVRNRYRVLAPYYDIAGHVVWGATAMILNEFKAIIQTLA